MHIDAHRWSAEGVGRPAPPCAAGEQGGAYSSLAAQSVATHPEAT